ncbi:MAG TPA: CRISPR-associated endonuclease Cas6 [Methanothrix sp.]|nr:CRISPR-associated endonuclease Cas6 [Methanothrix sp.]HOK57846.1 CRISPR-associated endonuclease Cas6 [Methanothrix sp.]HOL43160.1 CRISPR-associated endonuclease Cas6 [Methanothrix sp.]HPO88260.1 CRISPR-associated endonuclease Cas6 [Methanothrix sp.]
MDLRILRLRLRSDSHVKEDAAKLRGFFATSFNDQTLLHHHFTDRLIYRYPLIQYKIIQGVPVILGINEGADVLRDVYDKFGEIRLGDRSYSVVERHICLRRERFGCAGELHAYRFVTPWLALNQENYMRYADAASWYERKEILRKILVGNILSAAKGLGYTVDEQIRLELGRVRDEICILKGVMVTGIKCEFLTNFHIPDLMGLGKSVSRGFGAVGALEGRRRKLDDCGDGVTERNEFIKGSINSTHARDPLEKEISKGRSAKKNEKSPLSKSEFQENKD